MKDLYRLTFYLAAIGLLFSNATAQNVPLAISYQAALTDDLGDPLSPATPTNYPIKFRIYDSIADGNLLWAEAQNVSVFQGSFSTLLGTGDEITDEPRPQLDSAFDGSERYLEITITDSGDEKTFTPRQQMVSTPFAFRASIADKALSVEDGVVEESNLASGSVSENKIANNAVSINKIQINSITTAKIADGQVQSDDLGSSSVILDKLAQEVANRLVPAGTVVAWAGEHTAIPDGWLLCDGSFYDESLYPELFAAIGDTYEDGIEIVGSFRVPDYRGYFLRGLDLGREIDPEGASRALGSKQDDAFKVHSHVWEWDETNEVGGDSVGARWDSHPGGDSDLREVETSITGDADETRPDNMAVNYIIKAH